MLILAWLSYLGAIAAAIAYGESIQTAYDLYRFEVLKAFHLPLPANLKEERELNKRLSDFLRQDIDDKFQLIPYDMGKPNKESSSVSYPLFW